MSITNAVRLVMLVSIAGWGSAAGAAAVTQGDYPKMAPLASYLPASQTEEISLARSSAPTAISADAEILTLGAKGYVTAVKGKNHFVCLVERGWAKNFDSPDFWNPKIRGPHCFNAPAARSVLPAYLKRTEWVLAGLSAGEMQKRMQAALTAHEIPAPEVGSIAYMMSKNGYLGDDAGGHWHPHLMFYLPRIATDEWGANVKGSPIIGDSTAPEPVTVFVVPVLDWSDGSSAEYASTDRSRLLAVSLPVTSGSAP
jgi:hypothetical protein